MCHIVMIIWGYKCRSNSFTSRILQTNANEIWSFPKSTVQAKPDSHKIIPNHKMNRKKIRRARGSQSQTLENNANTQNGRTLDSLEGIKLRPFNPCQLARLMSFRWAWCSGKAALQPTRYGQMDVLLGGAWYSLSFASSCWCTVACS